MLDCFFFSVVLRFRIQVEYTLGLVAQPKDRISVASSVKVEELIRLTEGPDLTAKTNAPFFAGKELGYVVQRSATGTMTSTLFCSVLLRFAPVLPIRFRRRRCHPRACTSAQSVLPLDIPW